MRQTSSARAKQINAEYQARREAALAKARAMQACPDCVRDDEGRIWDCGGH